MTPQEQSDFVAAICDNLKKNALEKAHYFPLHWSGAEIKLWLSNYYNREFNQKHLVNIRSFNNDIRISAHL